MQKPRSYAEIYNDIDDEVVNLFLQFRDHGPRLLRMLRATPFSRAEHTKAYRKTKSDIERARRTVVKTFMGFGSDSIWRKSGFRANANRSGTTPATDWRNYPDELPELIERWRGVVIENRSWQKIIEQQDGPETLFYLDPPYLHATRSGGERYRHEMTTKEHIHLLDVLIDKVKGKVVLSAYPSPLYGKRLREAGWQEDRKEVLAQYMASAKSAKRTEVLWMNFKLPSRLF